MRRRVVGVVSASSSISWRTICVCVSVGGKGIEAGWVSGHVGCVEEGKGRKRIVHQSPASMTIEEEECEAKRENS